MIPAIVPVRVGDLASQGSIATDSNGQTKSKEVDPGIYDVTETRLLDGYRLISAECKKQDGSSGGIPFSEGVEKIEIGSQDIVTCDFVNSQKTGTITIVKDVVPDDDTLWDFRIAGPNDYGSGKTGLGDGQSHTFNDLEPGKYRIAEAADLDYGTTISCDNGYISLIPEIEFDLRAGENVTCTFENKMPGWGYQSVQIQR